MKLYECMDRAARGESLWLPELREAFAREKDAGELIIRLTGRHYGAREYSLRIPRVSGASGGEREFLLRYAAAAVYNLLSVFSAEETVVFAEEEDARRLLAEKLPGLFEEDPGYRKARSIARRLYGGFRICVKPLSGRDGPRGPREEPYGRGGSGQTDLAALLNPESFSRFSSLRTDATGFGRERSALPVSGDSDLVDVVSLCDCFAEIAPEGARRVRDAITQGVRYSRARPENCFGLSAYHPFRNRQKYLSEWKSRYEALNFCPGYTRYVKAYGGIMAGDQLVSWTDLGDISAMELDMPGEAGTFDAPADGSSVISLRLSPEQAANLAGARLVVLAHNIYDHADDAYFRVYSTPDVSIDDTLITAVFDGRYMQITDASAQNDPTGFVDYRVSEDGAYLLDIYPIEADGSMPMEPVI